MILVSLKFHHKLKVTSISSSIYLRRLVYLHLRLLSMVNVKIYLSKFKFQGADKIVQLVGCLTCTLGFLPNLGGKANSFLWLSVELAVDFSGRCSLNTVRRFTFIVFTQSSSFIIGNTAPWGCWCGDSSGGRSRLGQLEMRTVELFFLKRGQQAKVTLDT